MNVDADSLAKLQCANCSLLLCVSPITINPSKGFTCGRCTDKGAPITIYEVFAQKCVFPCRYQLYGCEEALKWGTVKVHEENCPSKPLTCPALPTQLCPWKGGIVQISDHFKEKHSNDIMEIDGAEIKLIENMVYRKFIKTGNGEYIFHLYFNKNLKLLKHSVMQLAGVNLFEKQTYRLKLYTANRSMKVTLSGQTTPYCLITNNLFKIGNTVDINALKLLISNTLIIQCKISLCGEKKQNNVELLKLLECPICKECMGSPIHQCVTGHSFCYSCFTNLNDCALCHGEFTNLTRNYVLEDLANQISHRCKNNSLGCTYNGMLEDVNSHEENCQFLRCPLEVSQNCKWSGEFPYLSAHCKSSHQWLKAESYGCLSSLDQLTFQLVHSDGMFFRLCRKYEYNEFFVVVQFVGPSSKAAAYSYEFSFAAVKNHKAKLTVEDRCQPYSNDDKVFLNGYKLSYSLLKRFIENNMFQYDIKIIKK